MKKILIIRFSSIGDIVLTTPVVRCLKNQLPQAEIHYLTKSQFVPLLQHNPYITQIHQLQESILATVKSLKKYHFDCIIDLHHNLRTFIIKSALQTHTYSFNKLNMEKWLMVNLKYNILPDTHIVERYLQTATPLGVDNDGAGLDFFFPPDFDTTFTKLPLSFIAIAIGGQHHTKKLPTHKLIELCKKINLPIILLGGNDDASIGKTIVDSCGKHITNYCGELSIHQSAYVISKAQQVITHDTGLMHIAAALQKPIISIWGNTIPAFGMTAYYGENKIRNSKFEIKNLPCRPCSKIGFNKCPKNHFKCMELQDISAIANAALQ
jgi:ADP-heptose:LPS heptosyltransferase